MILNSPYISGSLTVTGNIIASGSITLSGSVASASYASNAELLDGLDSSVFVLSSSFQNYSSSNDGKVAALNTFSASILSYTSSTDDKITQLNRETASLNLATASINNATASLYAATASIYNFTSSANLRIGSLEQYTQSLNTRSASFACVDSTNNFGCAQYFSNASNAISFTSTGSLYSDGGMRITKDMYVSGTAFFNNVTVFGTQSINYITSSQLNIASNLITVNTSTPAVRFGGLAVYDSGSLGTGLTGSILWDSENNHWVYSNPSGSSYSGGMFISGPRSAALGSEQGTTACMLMMGQGGDHITSSAIYHSSTITCIGNSKIAGNLNVAGNSCLGEGNLFISTDSTFDTRASYTFRDAAGINNPNGLSYCAADTVLSVGSRSNGNSIITTGNIGVGTACPTVQLQVIGTIATGDSTNGWGRLSFNTSEVRLQASKDGIDPIGISFWTQASGGAFAERMRIACDGKVGIGVTTPSAELQVNKNCDAVIAISSCVGVITGNRGSLAFYNCATSTVGLIRAAAVTDNVGTELQFHTRPAGGSLTQVLTLGNTGVASFACQVCAPNIALSGNVVFNRANTSAGNNIEWRTASTLNWYIGTRGLANNNFYIVNEGLSGLSNIIIDATTGATTFACQINTPTIIANNSSGFAACITSCSTDYSMYVRNMSSGFPLSIYTNGDSNGVNDDLKAMKIARASNDNQFLALSLIYGGFGYGYKLAPRYYNGSAYVCGTPTVIDAYGNIGIGITSPQARLDVLSTLNVQASNNSDVPYINFSNNSRSFDWGRVGGLLQGDGDGALYFQTKLSGGLTEKLRITSTGVACFNNTVCVPKIQLNTGISCGTLNILGYDNGGINIIDQRTSATGCFYSSITFRDYYLGESAQIRFYHNQYFGVGANSLRFVMSGNERILLAYDGNTCFANTVCAPTYGFTGASNSCIYANASYTYFVTSNANRLDIDVSGIATFYCKVCAPAYQSPAGFTSPAFNINYGCSYYDVAAGAYMGLLENGSISSYCNWFHSTMGPHAYGGNTEPMNFTCLRLIARYASPTGNTDSTPTYVRMAGYFYSGGWYCFGSCVLISGNGQMDGQRGYRTLVMPWIIGNCFNSWGDVTGMGLFINSGGATVRIGSVYIQYK